MTAARTRWAVIGAGWAGLAGAVAATRAGHAVTVFEAARTLGGRARTLPVAVPGAGELALDNGQHILIGAYTETLALMEAVGVAPRDVLLRMPLTLRRPDGSGLALPDWPAPLDAAAGILGARGWSLRDKFALLRVAAGWQLRGFTCPPQASVDDVCAGLTARVCAELIEPLCVSALNTPAAQSSGAVFLRVLRDSLFGRGHGGWAGSNLLLPRRDLGALFPEAAAAWLAQRGATIALGRRITGITRADSAWLVDGEPFDAVLLAAPPWEAARLARDAGHGAWADAADGLQHEAIATVYATGGPRLPLPMLALESDATRPAQFVFDRSQLGGPAGLLAFVVSASQGEREALEQRVIAQAHGLGWQVAPLQTIVEKRATFACTPGVARPAQVLAPGLAACGDYVEGPYPATIEGAVRSALAAVPALTAASRTVR